MILKKPIIGITKSLTNKFRQFGPQTRQQTNVHMTTLAKRQVVPGDTLLLFYCPPTWTHKINTSMNYLL